MIPFFLSFFMASRRKLNIDFKKAGMIAFLVLIVVGFTVPAFLNAPEETTSSYAEPRLCREDTDCTLLCNDEPVPVLCSQNLCQMNSCNEYNLYEFQETPLSFTVQIRLNNETYSLAERISQNNYFVTVKQNKNEDTVSIYSKAMSLGQIFEKANIYFDENCFTIDSSSYCKNSKYNLTFTVNDHEDYTYNQFLPLDGDEISIVYE